jgi:Tfp pilus assembly protein PilX
MKVRTAPARRQRGAALVIGLILLAIITLLAVVGMNISNSELASATSEQLRLRAFHAAEIGIERGLEEVAKTVGTPEPTSLAATVTLAARDVLNSPVNPSTGAAQDRYQNTLQYRGWSSFTPGNSRNFNAYHYTVTSVGMSARNTVATDVAGVFVTNNAPR